LGADIVIVKYVQRDQCEATQLEDEWVILNTRLYTITKINGVGGFCWSLLTQPKTLEMLVDAIAEQYNTENSIEDIKQDMKGFLSELMSYGLIKHAG
jgi:Coenzyme PQQ synthesis protein D (PqqD)